MSVPAEAGIALAWSVDGRGRVAGMQVQQSVEAVPPLDADMDVAVAGEAGPAGRRSGQHARSPGMSLRGVADTAPLLPLRP
jgi:hypothetical protein